MTEEEIEAQYKEDMERTHHLRQLLLRVGGKFVDTVEYAEVVERNETYAELKRTIARLQAEVETLKRRKRKKEAS